MRLLNSTFDLLKILRPYPFAANSFLESVFHMSAPAISIPLSGFTFAGLKESSFFLLAFELISVSNSRIC